MKDKSKTCFTAKDPQKNLANTEEVLNFCSFEQQHLHNYDLHGRVIRGKLFLHPDHKVRFTKELFKKPAVFSHQVLRIDKRMQNSMKRTSLPKHRDELIIIWAWVGLWA